MATKVIRSRSNREVGQLVEGCTILEKTVVVAPVPEHKRMGIYDYVVTFEPSTKAQPVKAPARGSFTRATPAERGPITRKILS